MDTRMRKNGSNQFLTMEKTDRIDSHTRGKKQIEPKKSSRMRSYDMPKEQLKKRREEKFKSQAGMKKTGPLTDLDLLTIMLYSGKVK